MADAPKTDDSPERGIMIIAGLMLAAFVLGKFFLFTDQIGISPGKAFHIGDAVITTTGLEVLEYPSEAVLGSQLSGSLGVILDGPKTFAGARRWLVDFINAPDGWISEEGLSLTPDAIKKGSRVRTVLQTDVFDEPNGALLGRQVKDAFGTVEKGPNPIGTVVWWYVNFERSPDGWVRATDLVPEALQTRGDVILDRINPTLRHYWDLYSTAALFLSFICISIALYSLIRIRQLEHEEEETFHASGHAHAAAKKSDPRFEQIHTAASSQNPSDWRQAIIEADILLDELLYRAGYTGASLGDKLKQVKSGDLNSIEAAWEAHKIRNDIAHRGSDFILTHREAQRVVGLYRRVFEELGFFS